MAAAARSALKKAGRSLLASVVVFGLATIVFGISTWFPLSLAMLLRHGLSLEDEATALEAAVDAALDGGLRTRDLGGEAGTAAATAAVLKFL